MGSEKDAYRAIIQTIPWISYFRGLLALPQQKQRIIRRENDSRNSTSRRTAQGIIGRPGNILIFEQNLSHKPEPASGAPKYSENYNKHTELWRIWMNIHQFRSKSVKDQTWVKVPKKQQKRPFLAYEVCQGPSV